MNYYSKDGLFGFYKNLLKRKYTNSRTVKTVTVCQVDVCRTYILCPSSCLSAKFLGDLSTRECNYKF